MLADGFQVRDFSSSPRPLSAELLRRLSSQGLALARGFPLSIDAFIEVLAELGTPLPYYGPDPADVAHPEHLAIHRVRYDAEGATAPILRHADDRSWLARRRPRFEWRDDCGPLA